jgi:hypothetical protein
LRVEWVGRVRGGVNGGKRERRGKRGREEKGGKRER